MPHYLLFSNTQTQNKNYQNARVLSVGRYTKKSAGDLVRAGIYIL
jgi:hypothetical protein